ncbi:MAG: DUF4838 domain-containing protein [Clostridia bacterium]|nr:DUF4838 domain-containing protein [Clostridia bacterium]
MKRITLARIGYDKTVCFAVDELVKYLKAIDIELMIDVRLYDRYDAAVRDVIWVGVDDALVPLVPPVRDAYFDDAIHIDVTNSAGVITGANARSVLIAAYRFLKTLGVAWVRPTDDGEVIPQYSVLRLDAHVSEAASYRHRAVCIEGAVGYEHVRQLIDWLPKAGMSGYFFQFKRPFTFFNRYYQHVCNELIDEEGVSREDVDALVRSLYEEIGKRGLLLHAMGHGWTAEPLGFYSDGWNVEEDFPEEMRGLLAELNGKRDLYRKIPLITNLCYSQGRVRDLLTDAVVKYCKENPEVDYLHFWLSDAYNNVCTCEGCTDLLADYYVKMLRELDAKMSAAGLHQKIVFLIYYELLWAPLKERLENEDRFVLMFAPISRNYFKDYATLDFTKSYEHAPYVKNKMELPRDLEENVGFLQDWQKVFHGNSFVFDYHLMFWQTRDLAFMDVARVLFSDMKTLDAMGLDGMVSCQLNRCAFPTNLPMQLMADALWNKDADFDVCTSRYFREAYGEDGGAVFAYLDTISRRLEKEEEPPAAERITTYRELARHVYEFDRVLGANLKKAHLPAVKKSWEYLAHFREIFLRYLDALTARAEGVEENRAAKTEALFAYVRENSVHYHKVLDLWLALFLMDRNCYDYNGKVLRTAEVLAIPDEDAAEAAEKN